MHITFFKLFFIYACIAWLIDVIRPFVCEHFEGNYKAGIFFCSPYMHVL